MTLSSGEDFQQVLDLAAELRDQGGTPEDSLTLLRQAVALAAAGITQRVAHEEVDDEFQHGIAHASADRLIQMTRDLFKQATPRCWREVILLCDVLAVRAQGMRLPVAIGEAPARREKAIGFALQAAQRALRRQRP